MTLVHRSSRELVPARTSWILTGADGFSVSRNHRSGQHTCERGGGGGGGGLKLSVSVVRATGHSFPLAKVLSSSLYRYEVQCTVYRANPTVPRNFHETILQICYA